MCPHQRLETVPDESCAHLVAEPFYICLCELLALRELRNPAVNLQRVSHVYGFGAANKSLGGRESGFHLPRPGTTPNDLLEFKNFQEPVRAGYTASMNLLRRSDTCL